MFEALHYVVPAAADLDRDGQLGLILAGVGILFASAAVWLPIGWYLGRG